MGSVVELKPRAQEEFTSSLGMTIFLASWAMMFCALFFAYGFLRARALVWPPVGMPRLPLLLPAINTVVLAASSVTLARGLAELKRGHRAKLTLWSGVTLALGLLFLALQVALWRDVRLAGITVQTGGMYGSIFYALTAIHAAHVAAGLLVLLYVFVCSLLGKYSEHNYVSVRLSAMFWHFVDVVWALMFVTMFVF